VPVVSVLEVAVLDVMAGQESAFEAAFAEARGIISASPGFEGLELRRCLENGGRYLLTVRWATVADHTVGFRQSEPYGRWKALLHKFYDPFPVVEHYGEVLA
jgi:heme-degrading monooxygenase HmoA